MSKPYSPSILFSSDEVFSVAIIILNYNTSQAVINLYQQIDTLRAGSANCPTYLVVDNASRPEEIALLQRFFLGRPNIHLILNKSNGGYACGNNIGLKKAAVLGIRFCLIANSDIVILTADFIEQLLHAERTLPDCGLIGPKVILSNGKPQGPLHEMGVISSFVVLQSEEIAVTQSVYATVGCCIFGATKVFERIDFFDEATFLYCEEGILAERLRKLGLHWYYLPAVLVQHNHRRKMESPEKIMLHKKYEAQSLIHYFRRYKNRSEVAVLVYRLLLFAKAAVYILVCLGSRMSGRIRGHSAEN